jgi:membrane protein YqaA with SNARE-associated domain
MVADAARHRCRPPRQGSADGMIAAVVSTAAIAVASAFVPAIPMEASLIAAVTTTGTDPVALGIAAGLGQAAGKLLTFLAARGVIRSRRLRRSTGRRAGPPDAGSAESPPLRRIWDRLGKRVSMARERMAAAVRRAVPPSLGRRSRAVARSVRSVSKRLIALLDRPVVAAPTLFLSALVGLPPLLVTTVYAAARTQMSAATFGAVCFVGRSIRFIAIALAPQWIVN